MSMADLAHHIIGVAQKNRIPVTNLQLQKVMFFALKYATNNKLFSKSALEGIYDKPFLVWRYGPVEQEVYDQYKIYGSDPIVEPNVPIAAYEELNEEIISLLNQDPFELVRKSHSEKFWKNNEKFISGWRSSVSYSLDDVKAKS